MFRFLNMISQFAIVFALMTLVGSQKPSACPKIFSYNKKSESNKWYGLISLRSPQNLTGIWLHIKLDQAADILGNWFGHVTTCDNTIFVIRKPDYVLTADFPLTVPFFVKFNPAKTVPSVETIKLNGKTICSTPDSETETFPTPPTVRLPKNPANNKEKQNQPQSNVLNYNSRPTGTNLEVSSLLEEDEEDDSEIFHFAGDFNVKKSLIQSRIASKLKEDSDSLTSCGIIAPRTDLSLQNQDTWPGQWPWHAALYYPEETRLIYLCGATLITEQHVIVPAHCVTVPYSKRALHANKLLVSLGKYNLNKLGSNIEIQDRGLSDIFVHPGYNFSIYLNDIAILKLSKPIKITDFVRPCCLAQDDGNFEDFLGKEGTIVGWGTDKNNRLMYDRMTVASPDNCIFSESTPDTYYCAEFQNGTSPCRILSIGGMIFPKQGTSGENTVWQIRGVNVHSEIQESCDKIKFRIFTDVAKYVPWIKDIVTKSSK